MAPPGLHQHLSASPACVSTCSIQPPVETYTPCSCAISISWRSEERLCTEKEPPANLRPSTAWPTCSQGRKLGKGVLQQQCGKVDDPSSSSGRVHHGGQQRQHWHPPPPAAPAGRWASSLCSRKPCKWGTDGVLRRGLPSTPRALNDDASAAKSNCLPHLISVRPVLRGLLGRWLCCTQPKGGACSSASSCSPKGSAAALKPFAAASAAAGPAAAQRRPRCRAARLSIVGSVVAADPRECNGK